MLVVVVVEDGVPWLCAWPSLVPWEWLCLPLLPLAAIFLGVVVGGGLLGVNSCCGERLYRKSSMLGIDAQMMMGLGEWD